MRGKRLTKLQQEYIDKDLMPGAYVAYPNDIFKHENYLKWKRERRAKLRKKNFYRHTTAKGQKCTATGHWKQCGLTRHSGNRYTFARLANVERNFEYFLIVVFRPKRKE